MPPPDMMKTVLPWVAGYILHAGRPWCASASWTAAVLCRFRWADERLSWVDHTYGAQDVWQFYDGRTKSRLSPATTHWRKAMDFPGAVQMGIMRRLFEPRPWHTLGLDQSMIVAGQGRGENHIRLSGLTEGEWAQVTMNFSRDGRRNDGRETPFAAGHKVDDIFFFVQPAGDREVNLLIDEVALFDAGEK